MNKSIKHRGPDDEGYFFAEQKSNKHINCFGEDSIESIKKTLEPIDIEFPCEFGVAFRRLSILDLTIKGHQPMSIANERYWIVFNGEIYNYIEIKKELENENVLFYSDTDTEVILQSYLKWGSECVNKFNGMWAFAIYDKTNGDLFCSRDRFGVKPFYYTYSEFENFGFASEIKALLHIVPFIPEEKSIYDYFVNGVTNHNNLTFFKNIYQLQPGHNLFISNKKISIKKYYTFEERKSTLTFDESKIKLKELLIDAIKIRQRADVPVSYALSGGIDSSSIVCIAHEDKNNANKTTFSLVFPNSKVDESRYIDEVVRSTKANSENLTINANDLLEDLSAFSLSQEQPFGSLSYYGEYKLHELINKKNFKVSIEGQGADEILTGYDNLIVFYLYDLLSNFKLKTFYREFNVFKYKLHLTPLSFIKNYILSNRKSKPDNRKYPYLNFQSYQYPNSDLNSIVPFSKSHLNNELLKQLTKTSIPEQLVKADKSSMAFSIESRFPFLDYRIVEFALNTPYYYKISSGVSKYLLRETVKKSLPELIYERKDKIGFAIATEDWLNDELWQKLYMLIAESNIEILNKTKFLDTYSNKEAVDWKFWKTISFVIWLKEYTEYSNNIKH